MPVGFLSTILCVIVIETGIRYGWWRINETTFPFAVIPTYTYGFFPVIPMWLLKYTHGRFGVYFSIDAVLNIIFAYGVLPWFANRGIVDYDGKLQVFIFESIIAIVMYSYQIWQEGIFINSERKKNSPNLQPAAAKPLSKDQENKVDNE